MFTETSKVSAAYKDKVDKYKNHARWVCPIIYSYNGHVSMQSYLNLKRFIPEITIETLEKIGA